jgi:hypothetical protein
MMYRIEGNISTGKIPNHNTTAKYGVEKLFGKLKPLLL